jgi:hypothetical protein
VGISLGLAEGRFGPDSPRDAKIALRAGSRLAPKQHPKLGQTALSFELDVTISLAGSERDRANGDLCGDLACIHAKLMIVTFARLTGHVRRVRFECGVAIVLFVDRFESLGYFPAQIGARGI